MQLDQVTIIVPTKNEARNIATFLQSIPPTVELIVVDASADETPQLIESLRPTHTTVLRVRSNIAQARQIGGERANTAWLLFTDADVFFASDYFDRLAAYDNYDVLYGPKLSLDEHQRYYRSVARAQHFSDRLGIPAASGSNLLISRAAFQRSGGFDVRLSVNEDSEIAWRIKRLGFRVAFAPDLIVYARDHRRLQRGTLRKTFHSLVRCGLLYLNLMPERWRSHDWGYWADARKGDG
ncbi:MAG: glycosyltransferase [Anaerolineae bacterium]|nr:glycosyltransferase [Anaerolineae bacterium]